MYNPKLNNKDSFLHSLFQVSYRLHWKEITLFMLNNSLYAFKLPNYSLLKEKITKGQSEEEKVTDNYKRWVNSYEIDQARFIRSAKG